MTREQQQRVYLLTAAQAGEILGVAANTLRDWRRTGRGPRYVRLGGPTGRVRYCRQELNRWVHSQEYDNTSAESASRH